MTSMPLKPTTVRFAADAHDMVTRAAEELGESTSQFVREAAVMRALLTLRDGTELQELAEQVRQLARRDE